MSLNYLLEFYDVS